MEKKKRGRTEKRRKRTNDNQIKKHIGKEERKEGRKKEAAINLFYPPQQPFAYTHIFNFFSIHT